MHIHKYWMEKCCEVAAAAAEASMWLKITLKSLISSGTDEVRAKRDPSLCNESVNRVLGVSTRKGMRGNFV